MSIRGKFSYLKLAADRLGPIDDRRIEQRGEPWRPLASGLRFSTCRICVRCAQIGRVDQLRSETMPTALLERENARNHGEAWLDYDSDETAPGFSSWVAALCLLCSLALFALLIAAGSGGVCLHGRRPG